MNAGKLHSEWHSVISLRYGYPVIINPFARYTTLCECSIEDGSCKFHVSCSYEVVAISVMSHRFPIYSTALKIYLINSM